MASERTVITPHGSFRATATRAFVERNHFYLRRLHSLTGIIPIGAFLLEHLYTNAKAVYGNATQGRVFDQAVADLNEIPLIWVVEFCFIWAPLAYHALYGLFIVTEGRNNQHRYSYFRNWMFGAQRLTGILLIVFLVYHVGHWRFGMLGGKVEFWEFYPKLMEAMRAVPYYTFYIVGVLLATFHFSNGIVGFTMTWGIARSRTGQGRVMPFAALMFLLLSYLGLNTLYHFHTGGHGLRMFYRAKLPPPSRPETIYQPEIIKAQK